MHNAKPLQHVGAGLKRYALRGDPNCICTGPLQTQHSFLAPLSLPNNLVYHALKQAA
jgi:hypothetical protein